MSAGIKYYVSYDEKCYDSVANESPSGKFRHWYAILTDSHGCHYYASYSELYYANEGQWEMSGASPVYWTQMTEASYQAFLAAHISVTSDSCSNASIANLFAFKLPEKTMNVDKFFKDLKKDAFNKDRFIAYKKDKHPMTKNASFSEWMQIYEEFLLNNAKSDATASTELDHFGHNGLLIAYPWSVFIDLCTGKAYVVSENDPVDKGWSFLIRFAYLESADKHKDSISMMSIGDWSEKKNLTKAALSEFKKWLYLNGSLLSAGQGHYWDKKFTEFLAERAKRTVNESVTTDLKTVMKWLLDGKKVSYRNVHPCVSDYEADKWEDLDLESAGLSPYYEYCLTSSLERKFRITHKGDIIVAAKSAEEALRIFTETLSPKEFVVAPVDD